MICLTSYAIKKAVKKHEKRKAQKLLQRLPARPVQDPSEEILQGSRLLKEQSYCSECMRSTRRTHTPDQLTRRHQHDEYNLDEDRSNGYKSSDTGYSAYSGGYREQSDQESVDSQGPPSYDSVTEVIYHDENYQSSPRHQRRSIELDGQPISPVSPLHAQQASQSQLQISPPLELAADSIFSNGFRYPRVADGWRVCELPA